MYLSLIAFGRDCSVIVLLVAEVQGCCAGAVMHVECKCDAPLTVQCACIALDWKKFLENATPLLRVWGVYSRNLQKNRYLAFVIGFAAISEYRIQMPSERCWPSVRDEGHVVLTWYIKVESGCCVSCAPWHFWSVYVIIVSGRLLNIDKTIIVRVALKKAFSIIIAFIGKKMWFLHVTTVQQCMICPQLSPQLVNRPIWTATVFMIRGISVSVLLPRSDGKHRGNDIRSFSQTEAGQNSKLVYGMILRKFSSITAPQSEVGRRRWVLDNSIRLQNFHK